jgi:hypothetical protein
MALLRRSISAQGLVVLQLSLLTTSIGKNDRDVLGANPVYVKVAVCAIPRFRRMELS